MLLDVRYAPIAEQIPQRSETTLRANCRHSTFKSTPQTGLWSICWRARVWTKPAESQLLGSFLPALPPANEVIV
jgi:hypothetical protein